MRDQSPFEKPINDVVDMLVRDYQPEKIILYGSCARGTMHADSDIDMLIIKNTDKQRHIDRWLEVRKLTRGVHLGVSFEPVILTQSEFQQRIEMGDFFIKEIVAEGKVLYERQSNSTRVVR